MCYKKRERNVGRTRKKRMREMYYKKEKRTLGNRVKEKEKYCTVCVIKKEREIVEKYVLFNNQE